MMMESLTCSQLSRRLRVSSSKALLLELSIRNTRPSLETKSSIKEPEVCFLVGNTLMLRAEEFAHLRPFQELALYECLENSLPSSHQPQFTLATQHGETTSLSSANVALKQDSTGIMTRIQMDLISRECVRISRKLLKAPIYFCTLALTTLLVLIQLWSNGR